MSRSHIQEGLLRLAEERGTSKTFCPSEVARSLAKNWRPLMDAVRSCAGELVAQGRLVCTQKGKPADPLTTRGAIRLALAH
ncbi:MAG: S-adenosylmethionine tRNA ribosyltransferase [Verrucomicrobiaceae bacterium]|nr:S-adenosylmethionine tRNA ribosyltransferase [Verrucomicrobiaceae bacterium]